LLTDDDSLAILNRGQLIRDRTYVLDQLYNYFVEANVLDFERESYSFGYFNYGSEPYSADCPRLDTGEDSRRYDPFNVYDVITFDSLLHIPVLSKKNAYINDSLVLRMIRGSIPIAHYPLYPNHDFQCGCYAANYNEGEVASPEDRRKIVDYPVSSRYRIVYRSQKIISLQVLEGYNNTF